MTAKQNQTSAAKSSASDNAVDEPVPSYETALREGAGGLAAAPAGPSCHPTSTAAQHSQPSYGCSPYTSNGTTRIVIVPASQCGPFLQQLPHPSGHTVHQALLPAPVVMEAAPIRRAGPRFLLAFLQGFMIYMLINILVDLTVTRKW